MICNETRSLIKFGRGDICITPAKIGDNVGAVSLRNCEPREIGCYYDNRSIFADNNDFLNETDVLLTFDKVESLDALIDSLLQVRCVMTVDRFRPRTCSEDEFKSIMDKIIEDYYAGEYKE